MTKSTRMAPEGTSTVPDWAPVVVAFEPPPPPTTLLASAPTTSSTATTSVSVRALLLFTWSSSPRSMLHAGVRGANPLQPGVGAAPLPPARAGLARVRAAVPRRCSTTPASRDTTWRTRPRHRRQDDRDGRDPAALACRELPGRRDRDPAPRGAGSLERLAADHASRPGAIWQPHQSLLVLTDVARSRPRKLARRRGQVARRPGRRAGRARRRRPARRSARRPAAGPAAAPWALGVRDRGAGRRRRAGALDAGRRRRAGARAACSCRPGPTRACVRRSLRTASPCSPAAGDGQDGDRPDGRAGAADRRLGGARVHPPGRSCGARSTPARRCSWPTTRSAPPSTGPTPRSAGPSSCRGCCRRWTTGTG